MATSEQIAAAAKGPSKPTGAHLLGDSHALAGAGITYGLDDTESAAAERMVRTMLNRHDCQAPKRLAEAERAGWQVIVDDVHEHPGAYCDDPRHDDDAALLGEADRKSVV